MLSSHPFACAERPALILSSRACHGGRAAAAGIAERISGATHYDIEDLIGPSLCAADFAAPPRTWLGYRWRQMRARSGGNLSQLAVLTALIRRERIRTVVATSHRAAFWVGELRRRGAVDCALWALAPDFHLDAGWTHLPWDEINRFLGALPVSALPLPEQRVRYRRVALPVAHGYRTLAETALDRTRVLVAAGARGLDVAAELVAARLDTRVQLACSDDAALFRRAMERFADEPRVHVYGGEPSLWPLMAMSGAVVTEPGAMRMAETAAAQRPLFLLPPRDARGRANAHWGARLYAASPYRIADVVAWQRGRRDVIVLRRDPARPSFDIAA